MSNTDNTLFLRLAGPMQAWGTLSRFQLRRTDSYPSRSGVLGMLLCAKGVRREDSAVQLAELAPLLMGVRVDRPGTLDWDYHTAGAKIGIRSADGKIKKTASTGRYETLLSRRQYLYDASFLVALQGPADIISVCVRVLDDPVWPIFLGRKCCVPAEPVFAGTGTHDTLVDALASIPWHPRTAAIDCEDWSATRTLDTLVEYQPGSAPPAGAHLVHDAPRAFGFYSHGPRWVVTGKVAVPVGEALQKGRPRSGLSRAPYGSEWDNVRQERLGFDNYLCVFCKSPAVDVHHLDYADVRRDTIRSLCKICHDACTMLEYGRHGRMQRIDPCDPERRQEILREIERLLKERRQGRRRELLEVGRTFGVSFFDDVPKVRTREDR